MKGEAPCTGAIPDYASGSGSLGTSHILEESFCLCRAVFFQWGVVYPFTSIFKMIIIKLKLKSNIKCKIID